MYSVIKILIVTILIIAGLSYSSYLTPEHISSFIESNMITAPVVFIIICAVRPVLFFLPSMGLTIIAGVLFGAVWGTVYVAVGGALSTASGYYFARWLGRGAVLRMAQLSTRVNRLDEWAKERGKNAVLSMRLFNMPWDIVSYWAGLTGIKFKEFYIASMIPLVPISFLYTYFGSKVFTPKSYGFVISLAIMFILGSIPFIMRRLKRTGDG